MTSPDRATPCGYPGCPKPARASDGIGRPPAYCDDPQHTSLRALRRRQQLQEQLARPGARRDGASALAAAHALNACLAEQLHDALRELERTQNELAEGLLQG